MAPSVEAVPGAAVLAAAAARRAQNRKPTPSARGATRATTSASTDTKEVLSGVQNLLPCAAKHCADAATALGISKTAQGESGGEVASVSEPWCGGEEAVVQSATSSALGHRAVARANRSKSSAAKEARSEVNGRAAATGKMDW
jgi:hypothetical protein